MEREESPLECVRADDGTGIPVRVFGTEAGGIPLVMLHGLRSHSGWFTQSARFIASVGHPVYAFDRRGSGQSRERKGHTDSFRDMVDEVGTIVAHAMKRHAAKAVHILGHCFGAIPGALFACHHPDKVASLILSTPGIYTKVTIPLAVRLRVAVCQLGGKKRYVPFLLEADKLANLEDCRQFIADDPLSLTKITAGLCFETVRARWHLRKNVHRLSVPLFMALAGRDTISDNKRNRTFFHKTPSRNKHLVTYSDATHILEFSNEKERFFRDLADWLADGHKRNS